MATLRPQRTDGDPFPDRSRVLGAVFARTPVRMAILDENGVILDANDEWRRAAAEGGALDPGAGPGSRYLDAVRPPADTGGVAEALAAVLAGRAPRFAHEYVEPGRDGRLRRFAATGYPLTEDPLRIAVAHVEIPVREQAEAAVPDAEREQLSLLEQAAEGVLVLDAEGRILHANAHAAGLFGYSPAEMEGMPAEALITPADLDREPPALHVVRDGHSVRREREGQRKDGSRFAFEAVAGRLGDGRILALLRDVSERRRRAEELERRTLLLAERVKEQRCLYAVSRALAGAADSLEQTLAAVAAALPAGWQYPELAAARITLDGLTVHGPGYAPSRIRQRAPLRMDGEIRGWVEVVYREEPPEPWRGGRLLVGEEAEAGEANYFLFEERSLLDEVAGRLTEAVRRHRAEDRLRRSEAYFRALTEKGSDLVSITTADGTVVYQSPALVDALGLRPEERIGQSIFDRIHPDDAERARKTFTRAIADPSYQPTVEFRIRHGDGQWRVFESTGRNLLDDPAVNGVVIESRDVTARWEARERIRFQAQILDIIGQAVVATDRAGLITYWNHAAEEIYGWARDEVLGRHVQDVLPLDPTHPSSTALLDAVHRGASWQGELIATRRDGTHFPALVVDTPILDGRGGLAGYVAVATDISDRKAAELALKASEEWSRALVEQASDLTVVLTRDGRIAYSSPNRQRILGTTAESVVGDDISGLLNVHPDDRDGARRLWAEVFSVAGSTVRATVRVAHANGSWRTLECIARNLLENAAVRGVVVNARDVTDRVHLEQQLQQAQKMEAIGRLAGGVAHDFNNLLTGIQGYTQLSLEELGPESPVRPNLEEIARAAERAAGLTRQLLAFSRRQLMQPRVVELNDIVTELRRMLTRLIGEDIRLSTDLAPDAGCVRVDPGQLEQVILNLAVNARDAMPTGGSLTIRTSPVRLGPRDLADADGLEPGDYVELDVSDTGAGMAPDVLERVFEPFFTTKELGKGTGLGLSTVYGIIRQSGGNIRVESLPGAGTTFRVYLPRVDAVPEPPAPKPAAAAAPAGETILLVEDDAAVRGLATRILRRRGYRVVEAANGVEAWSTFRSDPQAIDLVLSDVVMPELGGRELIERILAERPGMPVILMSGYTDDVILRHGAREVGADFLEKPFTPAALLDRVRGSLDRQRA